MKKFVFMLATATLSLAACTSDELAVKDSQQNAVAGNVPVAFDTYVSSNTTAKTRAYEGFGAYVNQDLLDDGFGIFAYQHHGTSETGAGNFKDDDVNGSLTPNFMYNQKVTNDGEVWSYTPLLYWPNQTVKENASGEGDWTGTDPQTGNTAEATQLDRVSFFAYAPYVELDAAGGVSEGLQRESGEVYSSDADITVEDGKKLVGNIEMPSLTTEGIPTIKYVVSPTPDKAEDLLWGVAPYGGLKYTAVNQDPVVRPYGTALTDLIKPDVNTRIKFLFQHALTALRMSIVASIDAKNEDGETAEVDGNSRISVNYITITSANEEIAKFATEGSLKLLNLDEEGNDRPNIPNWDLDESEAKTTLVIADATKDLSDYNDFDAETPDFVLNPNLYVTEGEEDEDRFVDWDEKKGVTNEVQSVFAKWNENFIQDNALWSERIGKNDYEGGTSDEIDSETGKGGMLMFIPVLNADTRYDNAPTLPVYVTIDYDVITKSENFDTEDTGGYVVVHNKIRRLVNLTKFRNGRIYDLKLILGLTSVKVEAEANDWTESEQEVDLPRNLD